MIHTEKRSTKRTGFTVKKVHTVSLSEVLKNKRRDLSLSLDELSKRTHINRVFLEALEQGEYQELPEPVFVKGFLKILSDQLNLSYQKILDLYLHEINTRDIELSSKKEILQRVSIFDRFDISRILRRGFIVILVSSVFFYLFLQVRSFVNKPFLSVESPTDNASIPVNTVKIAGITDPENKVLVNGEPIAVDNSGKFNEDLGLQNGLNRIEIEAINRLNKSKKIIKEIFVEGGKNTTIAEQAVIDSDFQGVDFTIKIGNGNSWVKIVVDGNKVFEGTMLAGTSQHYQGREKVILTTGNAGVTQVVVNGEDKGMLGREGEVLKNVEFLSKNTPDTEDKASFPEKEGEENQASD